MALTTLAAVNIQFPISQLIVSGKKTIETRTYSLPSSYCEQDVLLVETPGPTKEFKARAVAIIRFAPSFEYKSAKEFYADQRRHCVAKDSPWRWKPGIKKHGWPVKVVTRIDPPIEIKQMRGIRFTKCVQIEL